MVSESENVAQVFFASVHLEHADFYPDHRMGVEGSVSHVHNMVSVPLKHGTKSKDFRDIVTSRLLPRLADFKSKVSAAAAADTRVRARTAGRDVASGCCSSGKVPPHPPHRRASGRTPRYALHYVSV